MRVDESRKGAKAKKKKMKRQDDVDVESIARIPIGPADSRQNLSRERIEESSPRTGGLQDGGRRQETLVDTG